MAQDTCVYVLVYMCAIRYAMTKEVCMGKPIHLRKVMEYQSTKFNGLYKIQAGLKVYEKQHNSLYYASVHYYNEFDFNLYFKWFNKYIAFAVQELQPFLQSIYFLRLKKVIGKHTLT